MFSTYQMSKRSVRHYRKTIRIYHPADHHGSNKAKNWAYLSSEVFRHLGMPRQVAVEYDEDNGQLTFRPASDSNTALNVWKSGNGACAGGVSLGSFMNFCGVNRLKSMCYPAICTTEPDMNCTPIAIIYTERED